MKKIIYLLLILITVTGCNDWLSEPRPFGETEAKDMYSSEEGFENVLTGVYINMSKDGMYGNKMTMCLPEMFAQHWNAPAQTMENYAKQFNFESNVVKSTITNVWQNYYNCIVNLNSLLGEIDAKRDLFTTGKFNMIKGEALGLRAFLHFEVLRFWGPVPIDANPSQPAIPYIKEVTKNSEDLISISYQEVLNNIIADLNDAEELLKNDLITKYTLAALNNPNENNTSIFGDEFYYYRQSRFNVYAVKATKARYFLWINNKSEALKYAEEIIYAAIQNGGSNVFKLCDDSYLLSEKDLLMKPEHIFAIYNYNLGSIVDPVYKANGRLSQTPTMVAAAYENYSDDIRWKTDRYWENVSYPGGVTFVFKKYLTVDTEKPYVYVPVIRFSEMYLIAMECAGSIEENKSFYNKYMIARNLNFVWEDELVDERSTLTRLEREYRKDFLGEGQMFYYYKRHKTTTFSWPQYFAMNPDNYVIPKPEKQSMFE